MIEFFIKQHKAINLVVLLIIAIGINYFINGQKESFPSIGLDTIIISTSYPGASANEIDTLVTKKIENAIDGIEGLKKYNSTSSEGRLSIVFEVDIDAKIPIEEITDEIESEINLIKSDLPPDVKDILVKEIKFGSSFPIIEVVFSGQKNIEKLKKIVRDFEDEVKLVEGVGRTDRRDYQKTQIWIKADGAALKKNNIELQEIVNAISSGNVNLPAGSIDIQGKELLVRTTKSYNDLDEVRNRILRSNDSGNVVKVKDVAKVEINYEELQFYSRIKGDRAYRILVYQKETGDIIRIAKGTKALIDKYKEDYPDLNLFYVNDISFYVERRLRILAQNASIGLVLVFLCLIIFFNFKITFWTTMGIPFSFCLAVIITYSLGITLNLMSMFGFIIVIGMIVDDAIIVSENIYRRKELGEDLISASINGAKEMLIPVLAITCTTVVAFLPLSTLPNVFGKVLGILPKVVIITMIASFIECLFVLPGHIASIKTYQQKNKSEKKEVSRRWFFKIRNAYGRFMQTIISHPKKTVLIFFVSCVLMVGLMMQRISFVFFPGSPEQIIIRIETDINNGLDKTEKIIDQVEKKSREKFKNDFREFTSVVGSIQNHTGPSKTRSYVGTVNLTINLDTLKSEKMLIKELQQEIEKVPEIRKLEIVVQQGGPPQGNPIQINIYGKDNERIKEAAGELEKIIKKIPNTRSVQTSYEEGKEEIELNFDEEKAGILGVNPLNLANVVRTAFEGSTTTTLNTFANFEEEIDVVVKYDEDKKQDIEDIGLLKVKNSFGERIPIKNFATIGFKKSSGKISRENGEIFISVTGQLENVEDKQFNSRSINLGLTKNTLPEIKKKYPDLKFKLGGEGEESDELLKGGLVALGLALFGVFFVLTSIFKSYVQPFVIMIIIPFSFMGVILGLFINGIPLGLMPLLGMVALIGVVVNDSLVMVDFINRLRTGGMEKKVAIIEGAKSRLRPILMTSITTIVGLFPLAYGIAGEEPFLAPMALSFLWGLLFSTVILIFILPIIYLIVDDLVSFFYSKILKRKYSLEARDPIYLKEDQKINLT